MGSVFRSHLDLLRRRPKLNTAAPCAVRGVAVVLTGAVLSSGVRPLVGGGDSGGAVSL